MNKNKELKIKDKVLFVTAENDNTVMVALSLKLNGGYVRWFDTGRERMMGVGEILANTSKKFSFRRQEVNGDLGIYTFVPMTIKVYNKEVKSKLIAGQEFTDEDAMIKAFEETQHNF